MITSALKAQIAVLLSGIVLLLLFCTIASSVEDPDSILSPLSLCALFLSAFFGGLASVRISGDGILSGILSGSITALLILLLSLLPLPGCEKTITEKMLSYLCIIASSTAGAMIGKKRTTKKKPHKRRLKR